MAEETISEIIESHILISYLSFFDDQFYIRYESEIEILKQDNSKKSIIDKTQQYLR